MTLTAAVLRSPCARACRVWLHEFRLECSVFSILTLVCGLCWWRRCWGSENPSKQTGWKARLGRLLERGVWCEMGGVGGWQVSLVGGLLCNVSFLCLSTVGNPMVLWVLWSLWGGSRLLVSLDSLLSGSFFESLSPLCLCRNNFFCFTLHPHNIRATTTHVTPTRRIAVARIAMAAYRYTDPCGREAGLWSGR